jgi:hypothetical protein
MLFAICAPDRVIFNWCLKQLEGAISKLYKGRIVNLLGDINTM